MMKIDRELNVCGLSCPLPVLKAKQMLNTMANGQHLRVQTTDPGSVMDFQAFSRQTGNQLIDVSEGDGNLVFILKKNLLPI